MLTVQFFIVLIAGVIAGSSLDLGKKKDKPVAPLYWDQQSHKDHLYQCSIACGDKGLDSYKSVTGECKCSRPY